jgi:hypothetical protein
MYLIKEEIQMIIDVCCEKGGNPRGFPRDFATPEKWISLADRFGDAIHYGDKEIAITE